MELSEHAFVEFTTTGMFGTITANTTEVEVLALIPHLESYSDAYVFISDDNIEFIFLNHVLYRVRVRFWDRQIPLWTECMSVPWYSFLRDSTFSKIERCLQTHVVPYRDFCFDDESRWFDIRNQPIGFNFEHDSDGALLEIYIYYAEQHKWRRGIYEKVVDFPEVPTQPLPEKVICIDSFSDALTKGKTYEVVSYDERKGFVRVVGDNKRTRWFRWEYFDLPE